MNCQLDPYRGSILGTAHFFDTEWNPIPHVFVWTGDAIAAIKWSTFTCRNHYGDDDTPTTDVLNAARAWAKTAHDTACNGDRKVVTARMALATWFNVDSVDSVETIIVDSTDQRK